MKKTTMKLYAKAVVLMVIFSLFIFSLCACGDDKDNAEEPTKEKSTESIEDLKTPEQLESKAKELNSDESNFYGTWTATSAQAKNLYGTFQFTLKDDGTFDAAITDEKFSGTWKATSDGIEYTSELISGKMYYSDKCKLVFQEEEDIRVVLTKVE